MKPLNIFPGYSLLSEKERQFFELLKTVNGDSIWRIAIKNVVQNPDAYRLRKLVSELLSQASDSPPAMRNILGLKVYQKLMELETQNA